MIIVQPKKISDVMTIVNDRLRFRNFSGLALTISDPNVIFMIIDGTMNGSAIVVCSSLWL